MISGVDPAPPFIGTDPGSSTAREETGFGQSGMQAVAVPSGAREPGCPVLYRVRRDGDHPRCHGRMHARMVGRFPATAAKPLHGATGAFTGVGGSGPGGGLTVPRVVVGSQEPAAARVRFIGGHEVRRGYWSGAPGEGSAPLLVPARRYQLSPALASSLGCATSAFRRYPSAQPKWPDPIRGNGDALRMTPSGPRCRIELSWRRTRRSTAWRAFQQCAESKSTALHTPPSSH